MSVYNNIKDFLSKSPSIVLQKTNSPNIVCTKLPAHWRSNKSLQIPFVVIVLTPIPDGVTVTIAAGNDESPTGEVRNESSRIVKQVARFNDLRFVGKSGRGKNFHLTITVHDKPMIVAIVPRAIKVTVDGPRDARVPKSLSSSEMNRHRASSHLYPYSPPITHIPIPSSSLPIPLHFPNYFPNYNLMMPSVSSIRSEYSSLPLVPTASDNSPEGRSTPSHPPPIPSKRRQATNQDDTPPNAKRTRRTREENIWRPYEK